MIKTVLFDFDGTVINTNELIIKSYEYAFKKVLKKKISMDEILSLFGRPLLISLQEEYGDEVGEKLYYAFREFNESRHDEIAKPFEGATEAIIKIKEYGYKVGIVTSKRAEMLYRGLKLLNLTGVFDVLVAAEDTKEHKPSPEPIIFACRKLGVSESETLYVGDSVFDILCGKTAGTKTCGVKYSLTEPDRLYDAGMDIFVEDIPSLERMLKNEQCHS